MAKSKYDETINIKKWIPTFYIDDALKKAICFRENLIVQSKHISNKSVTAIGGYCISVESVDDSQFEFLVHVSSSLTVEGQFGGSKLVSTATQKLSCLEEKRTEFLYTNSGYHEKNIEIKQNIQNSVYQIRTNKKCPCNIKNNHFDIPLSSCDNFLCEGANILLSRYLAITNFEGTFSFQNLNEEGHLVSCNYRCTSAECKKLLGQCFNVYTVERRMANKCEIQISVTYMNSNGRILKHEWQSLPYILQINPLLFPSVTPSDENWEKDVEKLTEYLDNNKEKPDYLADHLEIKTLISDYVQTLLAVKPAEILTFTLKHILNAAKSGDVGNDDIFDGKSLKEEIRRICNLCGICNNTEAAPFPKFKDQELSHRHLNPACETINNTCTKDKEDVSGSIKSEPFKSANLFNEEFLHKVQEKCEEFCKGCTSKETNLCEVQEKNEENCKCCKPK